MCLVGIGLGSCFVVQKSLHTDLLEYFIHVILFAFKIISEMLKNKALNWHSADVWH